MMTEKKQNCVIKTAYGMMYFLGSSLRFVRNGFYTIAPFMNHAEEEFEAEKAGNEFEFIPDKELTIPFVQDDSPLAQPAEVSKNHEKTSIIKDSFLKGIHFESQQELVGAEIYVKDFDSKLTRIRAEAIEQIIKLSRPAAVGILKKLLSSETDQLKTMELLNALSGLNDDGTVGKNLFTDFLRHSNPLIRLAAIRALSKYEDEEGFSILSKALEDQDADVRRQALNLLCWKYRGEKCAPAILKLLHDVDNHVRKSAILICGAFKLQQAISALITLLSDHDREIQKTAIDSLRKITKQKFGFNPSGSQKSKDEAIEAWRFWWRDNQVNFGLQLKKTGL